MGRAQRNPSSASPREKPLMGFARAQPVLRTSPVLCLCCQRRQYPRPAARALVETRKIILLVRRMDAVVVESESDQQRVDAEMPLEVGYNRGRAAGTSEKPLLAPLLG